MKQTNSQIEVRFESLTLDDLDAVMRIERLAYAYPWSRAVFEDTVVAGYQAQRLLAGTTLLGYFVAMKGVEEVHLLNITVAPAHQYRGWAKVMLEALRIWARGQAAKTLWLEVRVSNSRGCAPGYPPPYSHLWSPSRPADSARHRPSFVPGTPASQPGRESKGRGTRNACSGGDACNLAGRRTRGRTRRSGVAGRGRMGRCPSLASLGAWPLLPPDGRQEEDSSLGGKGPPL